MTLHSATPAYKFVTNNSTVCSVEKLTNLEYILPCKFKFSKVTAGEGIIDACRERRMSQISEHSLTGGFVCCGENIYSFIWLYEY